MSIENTQDTIFSLDILDGIALIEDILQDADDYEGVDDDDVVLTLDEREELERELEVLRALWTTGEEAVADWNNGVTLIHEDYVAQYFQYYMEDIHGYIPEVIYNAVDWDRVAASLLQDYTELSFDGVSYYVR